MDNVILALRNIARALAHWLLVVLVIVLLTKATVLVAGILVFIAIFAATVRILRKR